MSHAISTYFDALFVVVSNGDSSSICMYAKCPRPKPQQPDSYTAIPKTGNGYANLSSLCIDEIWHSEEQRL